MGTQCPSPAPPTRTGYSEPPSELWDNTLFQSGPFWWRNRTPAKFPACSIAITTLGCGLKHIGAVFSVDEVKVPSAVFREDAVYNFLDVLLGRCPCSVQIVPNCDGLPPAAHLLGHARPDVVILAADLNAPFTNFSAPHHLGVVEAIASHALALNAAGISRTGLFLPADECVELTTDLYPLFDFVIRNHKDSSRLPLHHLQRVAREIHPTFRADFITRLASAARSRMENTTSSSFGTVQMSRVTYVPLGHFKAFAPMRDTELPWSRHLYDRNELLLGPPKSASRRQFLVSFIGNEYPTIVSENWGSYVRGERHAAIEGVRRLMENPTHFTDGYSYFVHTTAMFTSGKTKGLSNTELNLTTGTSHFATLQPPLGTQAYRTVLQDSVFCIAAPGTHVETLRIYEALEAGCVPIVSASSPHAKGSLETHNEFLPLDTNHPLPQIVDDWTAGVESIVPELASQGRPGLDRLQQRVRRWWIRAREDIAMKVSLVVTNAAFRNDGGAVRARGVEAHQLHHMFRLLCLASQEARIQPDSLRVQRLLTSALAISRAIGRVFPSPIGLLNMLQWQPWDVASVPPRGDPVLHAAILTNIAGGLSSRGDTATLQRERSSIDWYRQAARVAEAATDVVRLAMRHDGSLSIAATVAGISFAAAREDGRSDAMFLLALGVDPCNVKLLQIVSEHSPGVRAEAARALAEHVRSAVEKLGISHMPQHVTHCRQWGGPQCENHSIQRLWEGLTTINGAPVSVNMLPYCFSAHPEVQEASVLEGA